ERRKRRRDLVLVAIERDQLGDLDPVDRATGGSGGVGAAVLVLDAVEGLGLVRAAILRVGDPIVVVVRIGTAVLVFEAILVLRIVGALIEEVGDAVVIVVELRTPIVVLEAVSVLGLVRALVDRVG